MIEIKFFGYILTDLRSLDGTYENLNFCQGSTLRENAEHIYLYIYFRNSDLQKKRKLCEELLF